MHSTLWLVGCVMVGCGATAPPHDAASPRGKADAMVKIPAGAFRMATPDGMVERRDGPTHEERLAGYSIGRTEVTVAAYARCVAAGRCTPALAASKDDPFCNAGRADRQDHPINCVDWDQATAYCAFTNARLPTEAEWEYAARGSDGRTYPWGNEPPTAKRLDACGPECIAEQLRLEPRKPGEYIAPPLYPGDDGWPITAPVGSYPAGASPFGVLDLAGNVREWTADGLNANGETFAQARAGRSTMVIRGSHWMTIGPEEVTLDDRGGMARTLQISKLGFRCAR